ncbi:hypothetical protein RJ639_045646 [Escallonia herrerae]|uniref:Glycosyltransferase n=1 Tax=Escallonia herrerae TaxID=1293975 RepID=A0AA89B1Z3_9ASTE|nr:hypothetical protein RJ639_045646 [Escallonia herrerae]
MNKVELVFIPSAGVGHLVSTVEIAKLLISRNERLSITVLTVKLPYDFGASPSTKPPPPPQQAEAEAETSRIRFLELKPDGDVPTVPSPTFLFGFISMHKTHVRDIVQNIIHSESTRLAGFVIDMFCTSMIDVANEFGLPTYVFFTSGAGFLGLMLHLQTLRDHHNQDITEYKDSDAELAVPSFENPVPAKVLPSVVLDKEGGSASISLFGRLREAKGIMVNTFAELEPHAVKSLSDANDVPPVYTVGPILDINNDKRADDAVLDWLDDQPKSSVVFLCFGSRGTFDGDQVKEIAYALERSGHRFLWSLRRPQPKGKMGSPSEYPDFNEVLPEGFIERTAGSGKVIGWAPQVAVLSHPAVGGFVSHCGWNSTLESVWCGVPVAGWPLYAEQQMNAFELVRELGMAVEIKMDYRKDFRTAEAVVVTAEVIESGIKKLMDSDGDIRKKVEEVKERSRMAVAEGGSSYVSLGRFIEDVMGNIH